MKNRGPFTASHRAATARKQCGPLRATYRAATARERLLRAFFSGIRTRSIEIGTPSLSPTVPNSRSFNYMVSGGRRFGLFVRQGLRQDEH